MIDHILGHKSNLNKFNSIEIISSIFSDHKVLKLEIKHRKIIEKKTITWRLNNILLKKQWVGGASRWWKCKTQRSASSPQIHQKHIYVWNSSYRTPTERWQKTSDLPKGKKLPTYLGRAKEKRKKQRQKNRDGTCTSWREP